MTNEKRRPVDAEYLISQIKPLLIGAERNYGVVFPTLCRIREIIQRAPTVMEEPLIRCKDCRYWIFSGAKEAQCVTTEDWYCADGDGKKQPGRSGTQEETRSNGEAAETAVEG